MAAVVARFICAGRINRQRALLNRRCHIKWRVRTRQSILSGVTNISLNTDKEQLSKTFSSLTAQNEEISDVEFDDCKFQDCNFTEATFRRCKFLDCEFVRCNLSNIKIPDSKFSDTSFDDCKLVGVNWTQASWPEVSFPVSLKFHKCIINDCSFFSLFLDEIIIDECKAHGVDFREGSFARASFTYTDLADSFFDKSNLCNADFSEASNYNIDLFNNKIDDAIFSRHEAVRLLDCLNIELVD